MKSQMWSLVLSKSLQPTTSEVLVAVDIGSAAAVAVGEKAEQGQGGQHDARRLRDKNSGRDLSLDEKTRITREITQYLQTEKGLPVRQIWRLRRQGWTG